MQAYQVDACAKIKELKKLFLFMSCGTGKTRTALEAFNGFENVLVLGPPKVISKKVWQKEAEKWAINVSTWTFQSLYQIDKLQAKYDLIIIDECHRVKSLTAKVSKKVKKLTKDATYVLGLTGTWCANGYWDVHGMSVNLNINMFKTNSYHKFVDTYYFTRELAGSPFIKIPISLRPNTDLFERIKSNSFMYIKEFEDFEDVTIEIKEPKSTIYKEVEQGVFLDETITVLTKIGKLRQLSNGFYYDEDGKANIVDNFKKETVTQLASNLAIAKRKAIWVYTFKECVTWLPEGSMSLQESAAEGLNLQEFDTIIFINPTYSSINYEQARKRILRLGQTRHCQVIQILRKNSIEDLVVAKLDKKISDAELLSKYKGGN